MIHWLPPAASGFFTGPALSPSRLPARHRYLPTERQYASASHQFTQTTGKSARPTGSKAGQPAVAVSGASEAFHWHAADCVGGFVAAAVRKAWYCAFVTSVLSMQDATPSLQATRTSGGPARVVGHELWTGPTSTTL